MKTRFSVLSLGLLLGLGLYSCSSAEEEFIPEEQQVEIKLTSAILTPETRGANASEQSTQIVSGQSVGVTIANASAAHDNVQWNVGTNGALTSTSTSPIYYATTAATITAYHPYNAAWSTLTTQQFSVQEDQSADGYKNSDLLWTTKTQERTAGNVSLVFAHKLAKVNVNLTSSTFTDTELATATISIASVELNTGIDLSTGALSAATTSNVGEIVAAKNSATASAIVVPQTVASGKVLIKVKLGSAVYGYTLPSNVTFAAGTSYTYNMSLSKTELTLASSSITDWTAGTTTDVTGEELNTNSEGYMYIEALADAVSVSLTYETTSSFTHNPIIQFSTDQKNWQDLAFENTDNAKIRKTPSIELNKEEKVYFRGNNTSGLSSQSEVVKFSIDGASSAGGNVMSLLYTEDIENKKVIPNDYCFYLLFSGNSDLQQGPQLPATELKSNCYQQMFLMCRGLIAAPDLPATDLSDASHCYHSMFSNCLSLEHTPIISASVLSDYCFQEMFKKCEKLTEMPTLSAKTLQPYCYKGMFYQCTGLTSASVLPAKKLQSHCYEQMFYGCTSLVNSPIILATDTSGSSAQNGCSSMFQGCSKLVNIYSMMPSNSFTSSYSVTSYWVSNVNATGTYHKPSSVSISSSNYGNSAVPTGWTVENFDFSSYE